LITRFYRIAREESYQEFGELLDDLDQENGRHPALLDHVVQEVASVVQRELAELAG